MNRANVKNAFMLYKFEVSKFCKKGIIWGYLIIIILSVVLTAVYMKLYFPKQQENEHWRYSLEVQISGNNQALSNEGLHMPENSRQQMIAENARLQWYLDNDIRPYTEQSASRLIIFISVIFPVVLILTLIAVAKVTVDEFRENTAIGLYTMPMKRWKIFLIKFAVIISSALVVSALILLCSIIVGWSFFGFDNFSTPYLLYKNGQIIVRNVLLQGCTVFLYNSLAVAFCSILAIFIGLIFKDSLISALFGIAFYFLGSLVAIKFVQDYDWVKYLPFLNMNFGYYFDGNFMLPSSMSSEFSAVVLLSYTVPISVVCFFVNKRQSI
jgi:ABC-2 type transport system permease protein